MIFFIAGCSNQSNNRIQSAMIRYFDGSMDTVLILDYSLTGDGIVKLSTLEGREVIISINNVIIIDETEELYRP